MTRGRKPLTKDQKQGICEGCLKNKQTPAPLSKLGYKRYLPLCSSCTKRKYKIDVGANKRYKRFKKDTCSRCGFIPEHPCQLDVHHKDHNHSNNKEDNLETLCSNCHRLEHCK